jgi:hypothetical protein
MRHDDGEQLGIKASTIAPRKIDIPQASPLIPTPTARCTDGW